MSLAAALLMFSQSATPVIADTPPARQGPIAVSARASVRVLRSARISSLLEVTEADAQASQSQAVQRGRDTAGTVWIEFS